MFRFDGEQSRPSAAAFVRTLVLTAAAAASISGAAQAAIRSVPGVPARAFASTAAVRPDVIGGLHTVATIGSTVDALNGDQNPYGLAIAPAGGGKFAAGDLLVCNFNDSLNIQGLGTTVEILKPVPGSKPQRLLADPRLTGCAAIALGSPELWIAAYDANDNPLVSPAGKVDTALNNFPWQGAWGQAFATSGGGAFYESNANDGSIVRINLTNPFTFDKIITGFSVNHGVPGSILAPSGLTFDSKLDTLYIVDSNANRVVAIKSPDKLKAGGITVTPAGFSGPSASSASVLFAGKPLAAPIGAALLFNHDLVVGNTANNGLIEITPNHKVVGIKNLDNGVVGALFGIAASGTTLATTRIYFVDDNTNTVNVLMP